MKNQLQKRNIQPALVEACLILDKLQHAGFTAYIVGGAVRDTMVERIISDVDIATSATPDQVMTVFERCIPTGLQHGTVTVLQSGQSYEVTTYRAEDQYEDHRRPQSVNFVKDIYEDLQRRDFTMNAMALDRDFVLHDPFGGFSDLKNGQLRCVGRSDERFEEDALRMLRAVRFSTTYELTPVLSLWRAISKQASLLSFIAMERVSYEVSRMLQYPSFLRGVRLLQRTGLLLHTKEQLLLARSWQKVNITQFITLDTKTLTHINARWSALFLIANLSAEQTASDLRALKFSNEQRATIVASLSIQESVMRINMEDEHLLQNEWIDLLLTHPLSNLELWLYQLAPIFAPNLYEKLTTIHQLLYIHSIKELCIKGNDLMKWSGQPSGAWVKEQLAYIMKQVALGQLENDRGTIQIDFNKRYGVNNS
ncbi:MAG: CCA tRNA nucleotidyltransferase [Candidatus Pristimantibacillus lignocellulolyticus]|uniref:CCA tRNA nucleotidyltransferase n=1 Tax=Candidatus Pristimantibacillus lignocellulolyticus TaxID=2994561 RepID=A0A9J6ZDE1_9BACL|nr:MAG: CCA tRNA nucleotidyltransferase [Candidatus Pristimantibacillus lignocellulolyticus]